MQPSTRRDQIAQMIREALAQSCQQQAKIIALLQSAVVTKPQAPKADRAANS